MLIMSQTYKQRISNVHFALVGFSLLYGAEDPSIAGMVLDSAFSNLYNLMMELVDVYKIRLPKFTVLSLYLCVCVCVCLCMYPCVDAKYCQLPLL